MHQSRWLQRLFAAAVAAAVAVPPAALAGEKAESDDPNARRRAADEWYNETSTRSREKHARGGPFSPGFQRFLNDAARQEREKYRSLLPGTATPITSTGEATASTELAATGSTWVNIGPTKADYAQNGGYSLAKTDSGRVRSILTDPSNPAVLYVAFSGGGVWKSTDGGASWTPKTETLGSLSVGSLEMDPTNSQTLYLGLGDPFDGTGIGFVKSTDGGNTWMNPVYLGSSTVITDIEVVRGNTSILLVTTDKGLFRSVDGGASFSQVSLNTGLAAVPYGWSITWGGGTTYVASVEADPANANGATNGMVFRSTDDGATWTRATGVTSSGGVTRMTVTSAPSNRAVMYALASNPSYELADIFKSTNGGASWVALGAASKRYKNGNTESRSVGTIFNGQGWYDQMIIVNPTNPNLFFFGGALLVAKSTDGGSSYYQVSNWLAQFSLPYVHADMHAAHYDAAGNLYVGSDGGIFKSADGGATWSADLNVGIASHLLYDVASSAANRSAVIAGLQDNGTRVRVGSTGVYNQEIGGDGFDADIHPVNAKQMLGSLYYLRIQRSTDGGLNFASACSGITECNNSGTAPFNTRITRSPADPTGNTLYTFSNTKAYRTTNYATSWTALGSTGLPATSWAIRNISAAPSDANVLALSASGGKVYISRNGGTSWTTAGVLPNNGLSISDVAFDPTNTNVLYVSSVAPDATKAHVWKSTDGGATFAVSEAGLPAGVPVNTVVVDPGSASTVYAGTHLGVYRSVDGGATWARFGAGMPLVNVTDVEILPDSSLVRAATFGRSAWELAP